MAHPRAAVAVLIVDDQSVYRETMRAVVEATPGLMVAAEAACGEEALRALDDDGPQLAVVDVRMPGMDGIEVACALLERRPELVVLLVSAQPPPTERWPTDPRGGTLPFLAKEKLCPSALLEVWRAQGGD